VKVEDWGEVSRLLESVSVPADSPDAKRLQERLAKMQFFEPEYDTREGKLPILGGRSQSAHLPMLKPDEVFEYMLTDWTPELIDKLKLEQPRQVRLVGTINYTDSRGTLRPDYRFCYQFLLIPGSRGEPQRRLIRCPDQGMNASG